MSLSFTPNTILSLAADLVFAGMAGATIAGAVIAVISHRLVRNVAGLALSFTGLAGLYFFLNSPFLALMQMLIYVGAVCVMIMFAVMLTEPQESARTPVRELLVGAFGGLAAAALSGALALVIRRSEWMPAAATAGEGGMTELGRALLGRFGFAFELISVVLLLAILGALVVARAERRAKP